MSLLSLTFWQSRFKSAHVALWLCEVVDRALHSWVTSIQNLEAFELYRDQQFLLFRVRRDDFSNWLVRRSLWKWSVTVSPLLSISQYPLRWILRFFSLFRKRCYKSAHLALWLYEVVDRAFHSWVNFIQKLQAFVLYWGLQFLLFRVHRDDFSY